MLTNEQALEIIKQHDECYVVWATDQNMIVAVHPMLPNACAEDCVAALKVMSTDYEGPTKGRFLSSASTTLQTLVDEAEDTARVATRTDIFNSWQSCTVDQLIDILVKADFPEPMDVFHGSSHIVERIYKIHGPALTAHQINRLDAFSNSAIIDPEQHKAHEALQCYLCVLTKDPQRLNRFWEDRNSANAKWSSWSAFVDAAGDLPINNVKIIDQLISVVEESIMFGPRYEAMIALGKIGHDSGERSAQVITDAIYDSSESIAETRDRIVHRIQTPSSHWSACLKCFHGYVDGTSYQIPSVHECKKCLGLGVVPNAATG